MAIAREVQRLVHTRSMESELAPELHLVPRRHRRELEERAVTARIAVAEVGPLVVPRDLEHPFLHAVVEPRAAEDELAEPVDERLAPDERDSFPMPDQVAAESAPRLLDPPVRRELDEVGGLVGIEVVVVQESQ